MTRRDQIALYIIGCALMLTLSGGCVEHEYYDYAPIQSDILNGALLVSIQGTALNMGKDGDKVQRGAPYYLGFTFHRSLADSFQKFEVIDLIITGSTTRKEARLGNLETSRVIDLSKMNINDQRLEVNVAAAIPVDAGMNFEPLSVNAKIRIYDYDGKYTEESINIRIETKYRREKRSGLFDKLMSV